MRNDWFGMPADAVLESPHGSTAVVCRSGPMLLWRPALYSVTDPVRMVTVQPFIVGDVAGVAAIACVRRGGEDDSVD